MGNSILKGQTGNTTVPPLLDETQIFSLWTIPDLKELLKRFQNQIFGFALVEAQFESIISFKENVAQHVKLETLFDILDNDHDGRIDGLELLGGLALCCHGTLEEKARFCFELFDFNLNSLMSKKELIIMMMSSVCGMNLLTGGGEELEPDLEVFEALAEDAILRADKNSDGQISYEEFLYWARSNRELMAGLEALNKISMEAKMDIDPDDSADEAPEAPLSDTEPANLKPVAGKNTHRTSGKNKQGLSQLAVPTGGDQSLLVSPWLGQIFEPTNYRMKKTVKQGPDTNLELSWVFGFNSRRARNCARYLITSDSEVPCIVYFSAALGVVFNPKTQTQTFYMGHSDEITCLTLHPSQHIVATGDVKSRIHIWNVSNSTTITTLSVINSVVKHGIKLLAFSPAGDRICSVGLDPDHTLNIYDANSGEIISSAKGIVSPSSVYDIAYSPSGGELAIVGKNQVKFFAGVNTMKRAMESHMGKIGKQGTLQTFFCCTYFKEDLMVGCASGEVYRFKEGRVVSVTAAHAVGDPVLCMYFNAKDGTLLTGGKDCIIKTWDYTMKAVGDPIDMSEDVDGDGNADNGSLDCAVLSVQQLGSRILVGTRGSDLFEVQLPPTPAEHHELTRVAWGHAMGEIWGLAVHPLREEFATCGTDKTLRVWSIRSHEQLKLRVMPDESRCIAFCPAGKTLCVGMEDGSVALMEVDSPTLRVYATWKHCKQIINDIKFSPNGTFLAVGSGDGNIYLYESEDKKNFVRQAVCKGHSGGITHLDFSANSQFIQSNGTDCSLLFWDVKGNQIKSSSSLRDTVWDTFTCVLGWPVQGIWPSTAPDYSDINCCSALPDIGDIIVGDDNHLVKLYRYPSLTAGALNQSYIGHAAHVTNVRFSATRRYAISLGGADRTILLWRHEIELDESDVDMEHPSASSNSSSSSASEGADLALKTDLRHEIADVGVRTLEQEAANLGWTVQELKEFASQRNKNVKSTEEPSAGDQSEAPTVAPWKSVVVEPSNWTAATGSTDVDFALDWVHGYRSYDCRNNCLYSASGAIVYNTAALAVVYNRGSAKQLFLRGAHIDEVIGIAVHPAGQIFATGEAGSKPSVVIWNSKDMEVLGRIEGEHERGVPLLAFNSRGNLLASVGLDGNHCLCVHEWAKGVKLMKTTINMEKVLGMCFLENDFNSSGKDVIVTAGVRHLKFWWSQGQNVQSQCALWGNEKKLKKGTIMSVASGTQGLCVTGFGDGSLLVWKDFKLVSNVREVIESYNNQSMQLHPESDSDLTLTPVGGYPHRSAILSIKAIKGSVDIKTETHECLEGYSHSARYVTGDRDGVVAVWRLVETGAGNTRLILMKFFNVASLLPSPTKSEVRSVCEQDGVILIGTKGNEIYEVSESSFPFVIPKRSMGLNLSLLPPVMENTTSTALVSAKDVTIPARRVNAGHSAGEVWGLSMHPFLPLFVTTGDDCLLKCWGLTPHKLMSYFMLPDKSRAVDIAPNGETFALALNSGAIWVLKMEILLNPNKKPSFAKTMDPNLDGPDVTSLIGTFVEENPETKDEQKQPNISLQPSAEYAPIVLQGPTQWVQVLRYSFDGSLMAVGSYDQNIYVYDVLDQYKLLYTLTDHSTYVTHLDFGVLLKVDVETISQPADLNYELKPDEEVTRVITFKESFNPENPSVIEAQRTTVTTASSLGEAQKKKKVRSLHEPLVETLPPRKIERRDLCIQSTSGSQELLFWRADGTRIQSATAIKDAWWATFSCPYGWPVQGVWPECGKDDGTEINAVARSHSWEEVPVIATVDNFGRVRLYNYPCVTPGASDKCYRGHANNVTNIKFSFDDAFCVTVGGMDKGVFVWATDIPDEVRERSANALVTSKVGGARRVEFLEDSGEEEETDVSGGDDDIFEVLKEEPSPGDEAGAVKPWKSAIREPTSWKEPANLGAAPEANLELKFVYGYRGWDCRNNINFADSRFEVVYHVAGVGVVLDTKEHKQLHNTEHDDDILCLAVHPEGHTVATGEIGKKPKIVIWDANTGVTIRVIQFHKRGVSSVAFANHGSLLVSCGMDDNRIVAVHNVRTGAILGQGKAGKGINVYTLTVGDTSGTFVTGGKNHIKFWELPQANSPGGELSCKAGIYNLKAVKARTVVSAAYLGADAVTGMNDGTLCLWKDRSNIKFRKAHTGPVTAMFSISSNGGATIDSKEHGPRIISGGKDGFVFIWDIQLNQVWSLNMNETSPTSTCPQIQAVATKDNRLLVGTKASEIYEISLLSNTEVFRLVQGHFTDRSELWGLSTHPTMQRFATCGDDKTVRIWDAKALQQIHIIELDSKARAISYSLPDGAFLAVATYDGKVHILSSDLKSSVQTTTISSAWIQVLKYSPDGKYLAVGAHDNIIYLLETKAYSCKHKLAGHHSFIVGLDFSSDSRVIQSVSGDYELLFWDCETGKQLLSPSSLRDVQWHGWSCIYGWPVQGIWPPYADGTDINCVDRSPDGKFLVTGDDFRRVKFFQYPCPKERSEYKEYKGHSEHVMGIKFSYDGKYVFSVGGLDKAILQYEVKHEFSGKSNA